VSAFAETLRAGRRYGTQAWILHMLRRAEPSEAYPAMLFTSFEAYAHRIDPLSKHPWLSAKEGKMGKCEECNNLELLRKHIPLLDLLRIISFL
jgi:hypothetical protein